MSLDAPTSTSSSTSLMVPSTLGNEQIILFVSCRCFIFSSFLFSPLSLSLSLSLRLFFFLFLSNTLPTHLSLPVHLSIYLSSSLSLSPCPSFFLSLAVFHPFFLPLTALPFSDPGSGMKLSDSIDPGLSSAARIIFSKQGL